VLAFPIIAIEDYCRLFELCVTPCCWSRSFRALERCAAATLAGCSRQAPRSLALGARLRTMLAAECAAIRSALRLDATTPLFPLPQGDWRHWVGQSATVGDNSAWFALRVCLATLMNSVLLGYWTQFGEEHPLRFWFIYLTNWVRWQWSVERKRS